MEYIKILKNKKIRLIVSLVFLIIVFAFLFKSSNKTYVSYIDFIQKIEQNQVEEVFLTEKSYINFKEINSDLIFKTDNPKISDFKEYLLINNVKVTERMNTNILQGFTSIILILCVGTFIYKSQKKKFSTSTEFSQESLQNNIYFKDIAGNEEAKENAKDIIDFLKEPEKYTKMGARIPRGIIFYGSPGTGKTLMARAIASEAGVPFYSVCGSDFVEMYVGVGANRIRSLFKQARKHKKAVIFIDEIDALGKKRATNVNGGNEERDQTLNALLSEMSGFSKEDDGIVIIGTTNRMDILDDALIRAGRFDRHIEIGLPDKSGRRKIIDLHLKNKAFSSDICLDDLAKKTVYFSGAMLESLINEATIFAIKENEEKITKAHLDKAYLKVVAGDEKKDTSSILESDKKITAFHESGHALVTKILDKDTTISKISIIPSNKGAGGFCLNIFKEKMFYTKRDLENQIMISYAGRATEEIIFGKENVTTGAENDIEKATKIIIDYVGKYSMNSENGLLCPKLIENSDRYLQKEYNKVATRLYNKTKEIIYNNLDLLNTLASELILNEILDEDEINNIFLEC